MKKWIVAFSLLLAGCTTPAPAPVEQVCQGCGAVWLDESGDADEPIEHCPKCPVPICDEGWELIQATTRAMAEVQDDTTDEAKVRAAKDAIEAFRRHAEHCKVCSQ